MNHRILAAVCAATLVAGTASAADVPSAKPQYGTWGFDASGMDKATAPGADFFRYASGAWVDSHAIPADKPAVTLRLEMTDRTEARLHAMMEDAAAHAPPVPRTTEAKVGAFYKSFMDESRVESL